MSKGFAVRNEKGEFQIVDETNNYVYVQGGTATLSSYRATVNFNLNTEYPPIILIRPQGTSYGYFIESVEKSNGVFTGFRLAGYDGSSVDYRVFFNKATKGLITKEDNYGMRIRNPRGEMVFDSWNKTFWIVDSVTLNLPSDIGTGLNWDGDSYTHSGIENPWYLVCPQFVAHQRFNTEYPGIVVWYFFTGGIKKISSTQCRIAWVPKWWGASGGGPSSFYYQGTQVTVIICKVSDDIQNNP